MPKKRGGMESPERASMVEVDVRQAYRSEFLPILRSGEFNHDRLEQLEHLRAEIESVDASVFQERDITDAAVTGLRHALRKGDMPSVENLFSYADIPEDIYQLPELESDIQMGLVYLIREGISDNVSSFLDKVPVDQSVKNSTEIVDALRDSARRLIAEGLTYELQNIAIQFPEQMEKVDFGAMQSEVQARLKIFISEGDFDGFLALADITKPPSEVLATLDDGVVVEKGVRNLVAEGTLISKVFSFAEYFNRPSKVVEEAYVGKFPESIQAELRKHIVNWFSVCRPTVDIFSENLIDMAGIMEDNPRIIEKLLDPTIRSQGIGAFRLLESYKNFFDKKAVVSDRDIEILRFIATTQGVRAVDTMLFLEEGTAGEPERFQDAWDDGDERENDLESNGPFLESPLSANFELTAFLREQFPPIREIYIDYRKISEDTDLSPREKNKQASELKIKIGEYTNRILSGDIQKKDLADPILIAMIYHTFPPATTLDRGQYRNLLFQREDRHEADVPDAWNMLNRDQSASGIVIPQGAWELEKDEKLDESPWRDIAKLIKEENERATISPPEYSDADLSKLGESLLRGYSGTKMFEGEGQRDELIRHLYRIFQRTNVAMLPADTSSRKSQLAIKEFLGDSTADMIDITLSSFRTSNPDVYDSLLKNTARREVKHAEKKGIIRDMKRVLGALSLDHDRTNERLKAIIDRFGIHTEGNILDRALVRIEHLSDDVLATQEIERFLYYILDDENFRRSSGRVAAVIASRLVGEKRMKMEKELNKYKFVEGKEGGESRKYRCEISKKLAHATAGLNSGVCVAVDDELWNKSEFSQVILWGEDNIARGGMHFETVVDAGETFLSLPGINPSPSVLGKGDPEKLYEGMIDFAKRAAKAIGAKGILIPVDVSINSNRTEIHDVIHARGYRKYSLKAPHQFSYSPYAYSWQDGYFIDV